MFDLRVAPGAIVLAVTLVTPPPCQDKRPAPPADLVSVHDAIGTAVVFAATKPKQAVRNAGTLQDFVVDGRSGEIGFAAVQTDKKLRAVPIDKLRWVSEPGRWRLALDPEELRALRSLPYKDLGTPSDVPPPHCYASKLAVAKVRAERKPFGAVVDVVIERRTRTIAFVNVKAGGDIHPIPIAVIGIRTKEAVDDRPSVRISLPAAKLRAAPKLGSAETAALAHARFRARIYGYFDVTPPPYEPPPDPPPKKEHGS